MEKEKPYTCELCEETDDGVELFIGGPFQYLHQKCADIGDKAIKAHFQSIISMEFGVVYLANELIEAEKQLHGVSGVKKG